MIFSFQDNHQGQPFVNGLRGGTLYGNLIWDRRQQLYVCMYVCMYVCNVMYCNVLSCNVMYGNVMYVGRYVCMDVCDVM